MRQPTIQPVNLLLAGIGFLLLWEWILPLEDVSNTANTRYFFMFALACFLLAFTKLHWTVTGFIKWVLVLFLLKELFPIRHTTGWVEWFTQFFTTVLENILLTAQGQWASLDNVFRTLLFFILLWLLSYLLQYWILVRRKMFLFFFATLIYVTVLDTFSPYDATNAIVRIVVIGFTGIGILVYERLREKEGVSIPWTFRQKWLIALSVMIGGSALLGWLAPKAEPQWPDPVPFLQAYGDSDGMFGGEGTIQKIGYSENDERLGGPFSLDDTVVFTTETETPHYWRIETKDVYTGKGWVTSQEETFRRIEENESPVDLYENVDEMDLEVREARLDLNEGSGFRFLPYPAGVQSITFPGEFQVYGQINEATERFDTFTRGEKPLITSGGAYTYIEPEFKISNLEFSKSVEDAPPNIVESYTQLPENLPDRVSELAAELTANEDNWYRKARAIEDYLTGVDFVYDRENVAIPQDDEDYVDQFLFETRRGYCDNFSTSMVVMLRTLDIPARWVKGYTQGEPQEVGVEVDRYEVTQNNAHSWVEVYLPEAGWVPFEPTKGFTQDQFSIDYELDTNDVETQDDKEEPEENVAPPTPEQPDQPELENTNNESANQLSFLNKVNTFLKDNWLLLSLGGLVLITTSALIYRTRGKWYPHYVVWRQQHRHGSDAFANQYMLLLSQLNRYGLPKPSGQTLRRYAKDVDYTLSTHAMCNLTETYEELVYRGTVDEADWQKLKENWELLMKRTTG
ncbi:DUF4129 domain-containing transglutaminase family protein [Bacillus fonticola]|uniref:DUF4129 domain-containing transglutaminase family protein n=1 Tax=Bacillus fonticola TaxID=2728853 RepID=UPI0014757CD3|nr:DUF4129 domain-containing transglutaminase family protein [Bacillus fonticola]